MHPRPFFPAAGYSCSFLWKSCCQIWPDYFLFRTALIELATLIFFLILITSSLLNFKSILIYVRPLPISFQHLESKWVKSKLSNGSRCHLFSPGSKLECEKGKACEPKIQKTKFFLINVFLKED